MTDIKTLDRKLNEKHLLKHPFYQAWSQGELSQEYLGVYSQQYFHFEDHFTRFLSAIHSQCETIEARQALLTNLIDEESGENNHRELWLRFAEGIGETRETVINAAAFPETLTFVETFAELACSSYAEGLGALYAYERQIPEVAASKIAGLKEFYNIHDGRTLDFFKIHLEADVFHSRTTRELIEALPPAEKEKAFKAAEKAADVIWNFLSGVERETFVRDGIEIDCMIH